MDHLNSHQASLSRAYLCTREHNLARHEDEQHNLGLPHAVDETRE